ncbi:hypothetical protein PNQ29_11910 [Halobacterium salinarum]|uniref:hypothetical protein n=1 Tax=Halobacterium salinarum TaxID=2242 RepID=UPI00255218E9|nr:hypothetical protein [Halobacterium salinarum]MDL0120424.1 hypothetical protein [Halobacterium salinarum]
MPDGVDIQLVSDGDKVAEVAQWVKANNVDAVVTDSYEIDEEYQRRLNRTDAELTVILDDARHEVDASVLVNRNIYAPELTYEWRGTEPSWCLGTECLLLREPFRTCAAANRPFPKTVDSVVVTVDGVDRENRTPTAMRALSRFDVSTSVIVGLGFETGNEIRQTAAKFGDNITVRTDPENLPDLFFEADLAACTLGTTTYELLATQASIVGIPDNDTPIPAALESRDAAIVLSRHPTIDEVSSTVSRVLRSPELRRTLWSVSDELIAGEGQKNVVEAIETSVSEKGG